MFQIGKDFPTFLSIIMLKLYFIQSQTQSLFMLNKFANELTQQFEK